MNKDIISLHKEINNLIIDVETDNYDKNTLLTIEEDFLQLLELIKLFLITERDTYYGNFLMNMVFEVNYSCSNVAGIKLNVYPPIFESNPLLLCKFSLKNIIYIVCHEIDHVVFNHPALMVEECGNDTELLEKFNYAADASVNDAINDEIEKQKHNYMEFPEGCVTSKTIEEMLDGEYGVAKCQNYKYYYDLILDVKDKYKQNFKLNKSSDNGSIFDKDNDEQNENKSSVNNSEERIEENTENNNQKIVTSKNCKEIEDHNWGEFDDTEEIKEYTKQFLNEVNDSIDEDKRSQMPAYFVSAIQRINEPNKIKWQSVLKKYVGTISANNRKTKTRLNRRQPERFDLSGSMNDKVLKIVVAIDTSGSMSDEDISYVFNEIFAIIAKRKNEVTIIECDSQIGKVYRVRSINEVCTHVTGRGGTEFTPVIEYINSDKYYRNALLIYFTDGYGEYSIPKPKTYRNLWVVLEDKKYLSLKEPYGQVISLK